MKGTIDEGAAAAGPTEPIGLERFETLVGAYGADPQRWPMGERRPALALLAVSARARSLRDEAAQLDALLDRAGEPQVSPTVSPGLADRILAAAPKPGAHAIESATDMGRAAARPSKGRTRLLPRLRDWFGTVSPEAADWRGAAALAASLLVGVAVGYLTPLADGGAGWTMAEQEAFDAFSFGGVVSEDTSL